MKRLLSFLKNYRKESILAPFFKMLEAGFDLLVPLIMADIINIGIVNQDTTYILRRCGLMILVGLVGLVCSITAQYFAAKAAVQSCAEIRHDLFDHIQRLGFSETDSLGQSTLITRMTSDINQVQSGLNLFLRLFLRSPFIVFGALALAFTISIKGALIFAVLVPVLGAAVSAIMLRTIPHYKDVQTRLDRLTGITRENLTGVRVVRAFGREDDEVARFKKTNSGFLAAQIRVGGISALLNPLTSAILNLALVAVLKASAFEVNAGTISTGDVVALVNYMNQILIELIKLANLVIQMTKAEACAERISRVLALEPSMQFGTRRLDISASETALRFVHVGLAYSKAGAESLSDISFTAAKGQTVGIIGGTGSGKTSLISLIPRYYDATSGSIELFGHDIREYDRESLRAAVCPVMQKAQLFSGTIRSNLKWGAADADDEALWRALETAQAAEIVRSKAGGLDEPVEQGGRNFSGGQKQRLSIARSLLSNPKILILDDSSSALDFATDAALRRALRSLPSDMTVFIVSQRAASIADADQIIVLDEGKLAGIGQHKHLLETCPVYREIYESQFKKAAVK